MPDEEVSALNRKEIQVLVSLLPKEHQEALMPSLLALRQIQVAVDRPVRARVNDEWQDVLPDKIISRKEYDEMMNKISLDPVSNRGSVKGETTLHRVSVAHSGSNVLSKGQEISSKAMKIVQSAWASLRVGRPYVKQDHNLLDSLKTQILDGKSVLVIGLPGAGKTTLLRAIAQTVAEERNTLLVEKDAYNELGGNGVAPHSVLGKVLRMSIEPGKTYSQTLKEATANHGPDVLMTDEIKTKEQAEILASSIADGVGIVASVHGRGITTLLQSPDLAPLAGGTQSMTISDASAKANGGSKQVIELAHTPPVDVAVVMKDKNTILVYDYRTAADELLKGRMPRPEVYPVERRSSFDYNSGTGEDPSVFLRHGNVGGARQNARVPKSKNKLKIKDPRNT